MNHILINATHKEEIRVAIVKNKKLTDLNIETSLNQKNKGNIYKGKISRVEQSLEAAFVDYGKERQGFYLSKKLLKACTTVPKRKAKNSLFLMFLKKVKRLLSRLKKKSVAIKAQP